MAVIEFTNSHGTTALQDTNFHTSNLDGVEQFPAIVNTIRKYSNSPGSILENQTIGTKLIKVAGRLQDSSSANLESDINNLKKELFRDTEFDLKITRGSTVITYPVILADSSFINRSEHHMITYCDYSLEFICLQGVGQGASYVSDSDSFTGAGGSTPAAVSEPVFSGTFMANLYWKITFTTNAADIDEIKVENDTTGYAQIIEPPSGGFSNTETLEFDDVTQKLVYDPGTEEDYFYTGRPITFGIGNQTISLYVTYTGSAPTGTFQTKFLPKYS